MGEGPGVFVAVLALAVAFVRMSVCDYVCMYICMYVYGSLG